MVDADWSTLAYDEVAEEGSGRMEDKNLNSCDEVEVGGRGTLVEDKVVDIHYPCEVDIATLCTAADGVESLKQVL